nr:MAG TPA: hypothetical protein [Caudoviricetes sp.]
MTVFPALFLSIPMNAFHAYPVLFLSSARI